MTKDKYVEGEEYKRKVKGNPILEEVDRFTEEVLSKNFDNILLVATSDEPEDGIEDADGLLCQGQMFMKLGSVKGAKRFVGKKNIYDKNITITKDDYRDAVLADLITRAIYAHCNQDQKTSLAFARSIASSMSFDTNTTNTNTTAKEAIEFERKWSAFRRFLDNCPIDGRIQIMDALLDILADSTENVKETGDDNND